MSLLLTGQLFLQLGNVIFRYGQGLCGCRLFFPIIFQLLIAVIGNLLQPESGLDSLKEKD